MKARKIVSLLLTLAMLMSCVTIVGASAATYTPGTYTGNGQGFQPLTVTLTVDENAITAVTVDVSNETPGFGFDHQTDFEAAVMAAQGEPLDVVSSCTLTTNGVNEAVAAALAQARGESNDAALAFTAGTYEGSAEGCNGTITVNVTFSDTAVEDVTVVSSKETAHVGDVAFDILIPEIKEANGTNLDTVSGATFSSNGLLNAVKAAAEAAGCTNMDTFKQNGLEVTAQDPITATYDIVVVGGGGAGMAAAAQAAQDGNTVLVIEKNAEVGGNTLVSGGQYQSVMPYLVWDANDPDATTGVGYDGNTYNKVKASINTLDELKLILNWSEEPFDAAYYQDHEFVAGDTEELSKHGVHAEYLPTLQALKAEIQAYLDWAEPKIAAGAGELTLFSTVNLHIFQTYYGGLRPSADMSTWEYGSYELVSQFINDGQTLKQWLEAQGSTFVEDTQPTLIGALWYRENEFIGAEINGESISGRWGTYFAAPMNTILNTSSTAASNKIMTRTTADSLIQDESGRVIGVNATMYDGTAVTAYGTKGVILATGGYAANLQMVVDTNVYWSSEYVSTSTKTTNRSSLQGDGIVMGQAVGADVTGMGFTQMMPISWIDDGNLAFGGGNYAVYINPTTGKRFVDETSERDVLSLAEFRNGIEVNGTKGVFIEIANASSKIPGPYSYGDEDVDMRQYVRTIDQLAELFTSIGMPTDADTVIETIKAYDAAVMAGEQPADVKKTNPNALIGTAEKDENGNYLPDTYTLDGVALRIRLMAPSTHHTMGGLKVDTERHVLNTEGAIIPGLYAAGEVTGGIHGGNRLGGNAIVEIFVSGRTAAQAATADAAK